MRIHSLQHVWFEDLGDINAWAAEHGHAVTTTRLFEGEPLPPLTDLDCLIVLGGPMNIYDEENYPWLAQEKKFIKCAIKEKKRVLGLCLGAQLIADVLGGKVSRNKHKEIGWFTVTQKVPDNGCSLLRSLPSSFMAFHWHGDVFSIPSSCERVATSEACLNQAFQYEQHVLGLQFHLESTPKSIELLVENCRDEIVEGAYVQSEEMIIRKKEFLSEINKNMSVVLSNIENTKI